MESITSPVRRSRRVVRSEVDGSIGGICRTRERRVCVAFRYAESDGKVEDESELDNQDHSLRCKL